MLVSFTQTYGNDRKLLYEIYSRDKKLIEFKNHFDLNLYSFHNSSKETVEYFQSINKVENTEILQFNKLNYGQCIEQLINKLKSVGCTHLFFSQDDTFSDDNDIDFRYLIDYFKAQTSNFMICFGTNVQRNSFKIDLEILKELENLTIYKNSSLNFKALGLGGVDDHPHICTFDMAQKLYDTSYFKIGDIWTAEGYLCRKYNEEEIPRHILNMGFFMNHNMIGKNTNSKGVSEKKLREKGLL